MEDFYMYGLSYALKYYNHFNISKEEGDFCGVLRIPKTEAERNYVEEVTWKDSPVSSIAHVVSPEEASDLSGINIYEKSIYFKEAGWLSPKKMCQKLIDNPNIELVLGKKVTSMERSDELWNIKDTNNSLIAQSSVVVICNSIAASELNIIRPEWFPVLPIRGQVSILPEKEIKNKIKTVITKKGYICPSLNSSHSIGSTSKRNDTNAEVTDDDHIENIDKLEQIGAKWEGKLIDLKGEVGIRCVAKDRYPIVGAVPEYDRYIEQYRSLSKNRWSNLPEPGPYQPGLFLNIAHGYRGLTTTPICSSHVVSLITGQLSPLTEDMMKIISPSRFKIRELIKIN
eukprot:TRINITY_DN12153_c0_g1_i1.p1 TRINITY_DN12153_c0_g1~~TRINITY_DN12153_c0_g1_i1.p1  ORF type:complete len:384 (-),score=64.73 TRINITY_DN12153_c0_g1_i1:14-1036(-)